MIGLFGDLPNIFVIKTLHLSYQTFKKRCIGKVSKLLWPELIISERNNLALLCCSFVEDRGTRDGWLNGVTLKAMVGNSERNIGRCTLVENTEGRIWDVFPKTLGWGSMIL